MGQHGSTERYIAISIFSDALEETAEEFRPKYLGFHKRFKPWFCRHNNYAFREERTKSFRTQIQALIDQPGACLREDIDVLNFNELEGKDLTDVPPITGQAGVATEYLLVDTAAKMKQCIKELTVSYGLSQKIPQSFHF